MPEETLRDYRNLWFHTGDLGKVDPEGYFYFWGRKKESIRRGGENVTPSEKVQKVTLKSWGIGSAWDRLTAGEKE